MISIDWNGHCSRSSKLLIEACDVCVSKFVIFLWMEVRKCQQGVNHLPSFIDSILRNLMETIGNHYSFTVSAGFQSMNLGEEPEPLPFRTPSTSEQQGYKAAAKPAPALREGKRV